MTAKIGMLENSGEVMSEKSEMEMLLGLKALLYTIAVIKNIITAFCYA